MTIIHMRVKENDSELYNIESFRSYTDQRYKL